VTPGGEGRKSDEKSIRGGFEQQPLRGKMGAFSLKWDNLGKLGREVPREGI